MKMAILRLIWVILMFEEYIAQISKCPKRRLEGKVVFCGNSKIACSVNVTNINCPWLLKYHAEECKKLAKENNKRGDYK